MHGRLTRRRFYLLSLTWGLPMTLLGGLCALALRLCGVRPERWGCLWRFEVGTRWGGCSLGPVLLLSRKTPGLAVHECGHSVQNCWLGPAMPFVVCLPSALRYLVRQVLAHAGRPSRTAYEAVWFEGQATRLGTECAAFWQGGA